MVNLINDLRFGLRQLRRNPGFAFVAVFTLALGIGANTAIFSILDPLLLQRLPVDHPEELVRIDAAGSLGHIGVWEGHAFERFSNQNSALPAVLAFRSVVLDDLSYNGQSNSAHAEIVSQNYFKLLGIQPYLGRLLPTDQELGNVAVLGFDYWRHELGAKTSVLGKTIQVQKTPRTIIGIAPSGFFGMRVGEAADLYLPQAPGKLGAGSNLALDWVIVIGRLKPGTSRAQAIGALQPILKQIQSESDIPAIEQRQVMDHMILTSAAQGLSYIRYRFSLPARILMGVVGLVLLIACSNVANLMLAQTSARKREFTVRLALGARRSRILRQIMTESALFAGAGAIAGVFLAQWTSRLLVAAMSDINTRVVLATNLNTRVLMFSLVTALSTVFLCGLAPALSATRVRIGEEIKTYGANLRGIRAVYGDILIVAQVAMAVTALVTGGLLLHSLLNLETMPVGFDRNHVLALDMKGDPTGRTVEQVSSFYDRLLEQVNALPGVASATLSSFAPISDSAFGINLRVDGYNARAGEELKAFLTTVRPDYFKTMGMELLQGRDFTLHDLVVSPAPTVVNRSLAQHYFPGQDPVGKRIEFVEGGRVLQVIGVVADSKYIDLREPPTDLLFVGMQALTQPAIRSTLSVRMAGNLANLRTTIPAIIHSLDPSVRVMRSATLGERIDDSLHPDRLITALCGIFSLLSLALTCIGLYGVLSFRVACSTAEIGIRMAVGAERGHIFRLFVGRGMRLVIAGLLIGLVAAFTAASLLKSLLFGVSRADPMTLLGICILLALTALFACFVPARRATQVDPLAALRAE